jgi:hypothetical protein
VRRTRFSAGIVAIVAWIASSRALIRGVGLLEGVPDVLGVGEGEEGLRPEVGIRFALLPREAEVVLELLRSEGKVTELEDDRAVLLVGLGELQQGLFELKAVGDDQVRVRECPDDGDRRLIRVRVRPFRHDTLKNDLRAANVLRQARYRRDAGDDAQPFVAGPGLIVAVTAARQSEAGHNEQKCRQAQSHMRKLLIAVNCKCN